MSSDSGVSQNIFSSLSGLPNPVSKSSIVTLVTATAYTVSPGQSGVIFQLPSVGATISLPSAANSKGCTYKFILIANNATTAWTIASTTTNVYGFSMGGPTTGITGHFAAGSTNTVIGTGGLLGDTVTLTCDGTNYYVQAFTTATTDVITFS